MPLTLGSLILRHAPKKLVRSLAGKTIRKYSRQIGHTLCCAIELADGRRIPVM
jgi:hypothetical protein